MPGVTSTPVLFVSHGSPTFAVEPGLLGPKLTALSDNLPAGIKASLIVSAHWQSPHVQVMATPRPETIHDFGGFPPELYKIIYPAVGSPAFAEKASRLLQAAGFPSSLDATRGLDHGAWVPLRYLRPRGDIPVFQVSLPDALDAHGALKMGAALAPLRDEGVMIIGTGSLTHNLREVFRGTTETAYAEEFVTWVRQMLERRDIDSLTHYRQRAPEAVRAHPTEEHFLPLLVALGATSARDELEILQGGMTYGVLSMESYLWSSRQRHTDIHAECTLDEPAEADDADQRRPG
jgi:4,5-DOPA dioxygenase extradiol